MAKIKKKLIILNADKDVQQLEFSCFPLGVQNGTAIWKKLSVSYKVKHNLPHDSGTSLLDIYLTEMTIFLNIYDSFIHNAKIWK